MFMDNLYVVGDTLYDCLTDLDLVLKSCEE